MWPVFFGCFSGGFGVTKELYRVPMVARWLGVSSQRVRLLLAQGRIKGMKDPDTGEWLIPFPLFIRYGARGPRLGFGRYGSLRPGSPFGQART